jgi:hypothetical protein
MGRRQLDSSASGSSAEVKEKVQVDFYSPCTLSVPVLN